MLGNCAHREVLRQAEQRWREIKMRLNVGKTRRNLVDVDAHSTWILAEGDGLTTLYP